jgi:hypothetical protein
LNRAYEYEASFAQDKNNCMIIKLKLGMLKTAKKLILTKQLIEFIQSLCKISQPLLRKKETSDSR